jgi:uncharacterized protein
MGALRELTYEECIDRLNGGGVGRVAITAHALPAIVPVNFVRSGARILFRTERGGILAHGCDGTVVAFEIDGIDADGTAGWSVLIVGTATLVHDPTTAAGIVSAIRGDQDQLVSINLNQVSGRAVGENGKAA